MTATRPKIAVSTAQQLRRAPLPVLILDDERVDRYRMARLCSGLSFPCVVTNATTLKEFEAELNRTSFGLILLDYKLQEGTGLDALDMVRLSSLNLNARTVMVSGMETAGIGERARAAGCAGFMSKDNLSQEHFAIAIEDVLGLHQRQISVDQKTFSAAEVEKLLVLNSAKTVREIKPMVSRLLRQMRDNRAGGRLPSDTGSVKLEDNCMSLWLALVEMERGSKAIGLADIAKDTQGTPAGMVKAKNGKPPSPFARLQH